MFRRRKPANQPGVVLDTADWSNTRRTPEMHEWVTPSGDGIELRYTASASELPAALSDIGELRAVYRRMLETTVGVVELDACEVDGVPAVRGVFRSQDSIDDLLYAGMLVIPRRDFEFSISVACVAIRPIGLRDSIVFARLFRDGLVEPDDDGNVAGWRHDPYDPSYQGFVMATLADDARWDDDFPDHALSRCRRLQEHIIETTAVADWVRQSAPFDGPA